MIGSSESTRRRSEADISRDVLTTFLDQLRNDPVLDQTFCDWLRRVDASYILDLEKLKADVHSVDFQTARAILLDFADFNKISST